MECRKTHGCCLFVAMLTTSEGLRKNTQVKIKSYGIHKGREIKHGITVTLADVCRRDKCVRI